MNRWISGTFISGDTSGTAASAKPEKTVRRPRVLGPGLTAATLLRLVSPVTASVKVIVPLRLGSRSSRWVSRRPSIPTAMPTSPPGSANRLALESLKSARASVVRDCRLSSNTIESIAACDDGVQSLIDGVALQPPLNGL